MRSWVEIDDRVEVEHQVGEHGADARRRASWAATSAARRRACRPARAPRSTRVTTGLNAAETGCSARISATSTAPVARLFSSSCRPTSSGDSRLAAMPEPTTAATRNAGADQLGDRRAGAMGGGHAGDAAEQGAEVGQRLGADPVVDPDAALAAVEQADLVEHLEVVADRRLGEVEGVVEVAHAGLAVGVRGDQGQQPQPHRVGERLEQRRDPLGLRRRSAAPWSAASSRPPSRRA